MIFKELLNEQNFLFKLIKKESNQRIPLADVKKHFWIVEHKDKK